MALGLLGNTVWLELMEEVRSVNYLNLLTIFNHHFYLLQFRTASLLLRSILKLYLSFSYFCVASI